MLSHRIPPLINLILFSMASFFSLSLIGCVASPCVSVPANENLAMKGFLYSAQCRILRSGLMRHLLPLFPSRLQQMADLLAYLNLKQQSEQQDTLTSCVAGKRDLNRVLLRVQGVCGNAHASGRLSEAWAAAGRFRPPLPGQARLWPTRNLWPLGGRWLL